MNKSIIPNSPKHRDVPLSAQLYRLVLLEGKDAPTNEALAAMRSIKVDPCGGGGVMFALTIEGREAELHFEADGDIALYWFSER